LFKQAIDMVEYVQVTLKDEVANFQVEKVAPESAGDFKAVYKCIILGGEGE